MNRFGLITSILLLTNAAVPSLLAQESTSSEIDERLKKLESLIEKQRVDNHIPGLALAVVKDDKVIFAKGFGLRDVENQTPVTPETRFAAGSTTKAFTSAVIGMLVDEGKMKWDDPISKHIPSLKLDVETNGEEVSVRDLLCHRSGFTRLSLLWASGNPTRSEVLSYVAKAKPYAKFRQQFLYNNVMYMAAGRAAGHSADSTWDSLIKERIFKPLGMNNSNTSIAAASEDPEMSLGYQWDEDAKEFEHLPMRDLNPIAPAGAINSNILDMAKWVRFQLAKGKFDGKQLLSEEQHGQTWRQHIPIPGGAHYGLGWMLRTWQGEKVVEHGGNIDGFAAQVSLLPKHNAGYVLLTNVTATPLQGTSIPLVFDTLFGEEQDDNGLAEINTDELLGTYIANFGQFDNAKLDVKMKGDNLAVNVPGQTLYELKPPNDEGKWYFAVTDTIAVSFNKDDDGKVMSISFYQNGMNPEFLREGYEQEPDAPLNVTAPLVGKYQDPNDQSELEISVRQGRVIANAGRRGIFALLPPDKDGKWALRPRPELIQFRFNKNADGTIKSVTRLQGDKEVEMARMAGTEAAPDIPSVDELFAKLREKTGTMSDKVAAVRMVGSATFIHQGVSGDIRSIFTADGKHATRQDFGRVASMVRVYDGEKGFSDTSMSEFEELAGKELVSLKLEHPVWTAADWDKHFTDTSITGEEMIDGDRCFVVTLSGEDVIQRKIFLSKESGLVVREIRQLPIHNVGQLPVTINYSDFRKVAGVTIPFKTTSDNVAVGSIVVQLDKVEELQSVPDGAFSAEPIDKE